MKFPAKKFVIWDPQEIFFKLAQKFLNKFFVIYISTGP